MFGNLINKGRSEEEGEGEGKGKADKLNPVVRLTRLAHGAPPTQLSLPFRPPRLVLPLPRDPRGDGPFIRPRGPSQPSTVDVHASGGPEADALRDRHASAHLAPTVRVHREGRHVGGSLRSAAQRIGASSPPSPRYGAANHTPRMWRESRGGPACLRPFAATSTSLHGLLRHRPSWAGPCRLPTTP
ncbi:hypothetical protein BHM03_00048540 [Ensete ventricosum]|uniref:Uncharacterized protein n=1 Tax=Ensete ventricosum TaxID=4639 RepID=A0A445ML91_ENSVE|nr:hypothetical protein BHM03_00048540 [Ensete ventricosum]